LRDHQHGPAAVADRAVHLVFLIVEDAQAGHFAGQIVDVGFGVAPADSQQHQ